MAMADYWDSITGNDYLADPLLTDPYGPDVIPADLTVADPTTPSPGVVGQLSNLVGNTGSLVKWLAVLIAVWIVYKLIKLVT